VSASPSPKDALGLRLIVGYKFARGIVAIALALTLAAEAQRDGGAFLRDLAFWLRENFAGMWSLHLADLLVRVSSPHNLEIGAAALAFDGLFASFEGWALHRRFRWAPWLVIVATASLLPLELYEIVRGVHLGRVFIFAANVAILVYLVRRRAKESSNAGHG
jgi:uncharacterized membrane protein (DUF2068 family)